MKYLYIFEDGIVALSDDPPTSEDLACVGDGILQVIQLSVDADESALLDYAYPVAYDIDQNGEITPLATAVIRTEEGVRFHVPE